MPNFIQFAFAHPAKLKITLRNKCRIPKMLEKSLIQAVLCGYSLKCFEAFDPQTLTNRDDKIPASHVWELSADAQSFTTQGSSCTNFLGSLSLIISKVGSHQSFPDLIYNPVISGMTAPYVGAEREVNHCQALLFFIPAETQLTRQAQVYSAICSGAETELLRDFKANL